MSENNDNSKPKSEFGLVFIIVGCGLLFVAFLEFVGLMSYRPHREPLGAGFWTITGLSCVAAGFVIKRFFK